MWKSYDETDRHFYSKHSCITTVLDSCILNKLVFESGSWAGNEYHSRSFKRSDSSLLSGPGVFAAPRVVFPADIFLISPPACADVCEKDYFKLNDELFFFFFLFSLLKHMDIFQTGGCERAVKTRSRLFTTYLDENLWRWPPREAAAAAAQRTIFDCVHQRHLVLQRHSLVITGPHPNVRHLCSIPSSLSA